MTPPAPAVPYRPERRRPRRDRDACGLPSPEDRKKLALTCLTWQRTLWPEVLGRAPRLLPDPADDSALMTMAEDFRGRHTGEAKPTRLAPGLLRAVAAVVGLAAAYLRYSCDNSNPRSFDDQLGNTLRKAKELGIVIPWSWLYADASVSGTIAARRGYSSLKAAMADKEAPREASVILIDEFTRGGRDTLEWLKLAISVMRLGTRVRLFSPNQSLLDSPERIVRDPLRRPVALDGDGGRLPAHVHDAVTSILRR